MAAESRKPKSPDDMLLARMRQTYRFATLVDYMLYDGVLYRRCPICRCRPIPTNAGSVMWCDPCIDEALSTNESLSTFINRKRKVPNG